MENPGAAAVALATIGAFGVVVKWVVAAIRRQWPRIQGTWVQVLAAGLGIAGAAAFDLQGTEALVQTIGATVNRIPPTPVDYVITGVAIAAASGFFHDRDPEPAPVIEVDATGSPIL